MDFCGIDAIIYMFPTSVYMKIAHWSFWHMDSIRSMYSFSFSPFRSEELVAAVAESASALTLQEPDVSSPEELLDTTSSEGSITDSPRSVLHNITDSSQPSKLASKILSRSTRNWYQVIYIRKDCEGSFCMYPSLGGPFQSIDEADDAIDRYLDELRHRAM
jgi:hypothetical protein